jgi:hypothetical protein
MAESDRALQRQEHRSMTHDRVDRGDAAPVGSGNAIPVRNSIPANHPRRPPPSARRADIPARRRRWLTGGWGTPGLRVISNSFLQGAGSLGAVVCLREPTRLTRTAAPNATRVRRWRCNRISTRDDDRRRAPPQPRASAGAFRVLYGRYAKRTYGFHLSRTRNTDAAHAREKNPDIGLSQIRRACP